ncbi:ribonuclease H-like domain-containing protein [Tanacetum coccineum]
MKHTLQVYIPIWQVMLPFLMAMSGLTLIFLSIFANSSRCVKTITLGWILDSGANEHLNVSTVGMFNIVDISDLKIIVGHLNGTSATISHVQNLRLTFNVVLYDVLVVPSYYRGGVLRTGSKNGSLYLLDINNDSSVGKSNVVLSFYVSKLLWHNRLGHPADQVLYVLKNELSISKNTSVLFVSPNDKGKDSSVEESSIQPSDDIADSAQDVNNAFLYGDLKEDVYMSLPQGYDSGTKNKHGFEQSKFDYSLYLQNKGSMFVALLVYVDDIMITRNDETKINASKKFFSTKFLIKDLELLHEYGFLAAKPVDIPFPENTILNHHMHTPLHSHFKAALRGFRYLKGSPILGKGVERVKQKDMRSKQNISA